MSPATTPFARVLVMGASAGAIDALGEILPRLYPGFPWPVIVVVHLPADRPSLLTDVFAAKLVVAVREAEDKLPLEPATVYFAPPDYHLLVERDGTLALNVDERVLFSRPSIDVLFESAADAFGSRAIGVALSGASADGARGLDHIRRTGGLTMVQSPETASARALPEAAIELANPHYILAPRSIADHLLALSRGETHP